MKNLLIFLICLFPLLISCETLEGSQIDAYTQTEDTHPVSQEDQKIMLEAISSERERQLSYFKALEKEYADKEKASDPVSIIKENIENSRIEVQSSSNFRNAITYYTYIDGLIYDIYFNPDHVTDIRLEEGEALNSSLVMGNPSMWVAEHITSSENGQSITHLLIRPLQINIETDCMVVTDRRVYYLRLISTSKTPQVCVCFTYPFSEMHEETGSVSPFVMDLGNENSAVTLGKTVSDLNFNYQIVGKASWKPKRVYSDTIRTYIQFDNSFLTNSESPYLYLRKKGSDELVNFTAKGVTYICPIILSGDEVFVLKSGKTEVLIGY